MQSHPHSFSKTLTPQIETNKFLWNSCFAVLYTATLHLYKLCTHLFSNKCVPWTTGHTLAVIVKTITCTVKYPIIGICPHAKYPYSSADLMASWFCFL